MKVREAFGYRQDILWKILQEKPGEEMEWDVLRQELALRSHSGVSDVQLGYGIRMLRKERVQPPNELKITGAAGEAAARKVVLHLREGDVSRRQREEVEPKTAIATGAWYVLLGKCSNDEDPPHLLMPRPDHWPEPLRNMLRSLRSRSFAHLVLDSGSTVRALSRSLLEKNPIPFHAYTRPFGTGDSTADQSLVDPHPNRRVTPTILTNSPQVAVDILESPHFHDLQVKLLGGSVSGDSMSTAGTLAEDCLSAWGYSGKFTGADVAILGARGFRSFMDGSSGFTVMHLSQGQIKLRLFAFAAVRCIALSSSKLPEKLNGSGGDGLGRFVGLDPAEVNIVFTDASHAAEAASFACEAFRMGVMPVITGINAKQVHEAFVALKKERSTDPARWQIYSTSSSIDYHPGNSDGPDMGTSP